jgi:hypothetical protein
MEKGEMGRRRRVDLGRGELGRVERKRGNEGLEMVVSGKYGQRGKGEVSKGNPGMVCVRIGRLKMEIEGGE